MTDETHEDEASAVLGGQNGRLVVPEHMTLKQHSIFKGEIPFLTFSIEGKDVGKLWGTGGALSFEGDLDESAKIFFQQVIELNRSLLEA